MVKIISDKDFNPSEKEDIDFLWDVCYNAEWPEVTKKKFQGVLKDLIDETLPENILIPTNSHLQVLMEVWKSWSSISSQQKSESVLLLKEVGEKR